MRHSIIRLFTQIHTVKSLWIFQAAKDIVTLDDDDDDDDGDDDGVNTPGDALDDSLLQDGDDSIMLKIIEDPEPVIATEPSTSSFKVLQHVMLHLYGLNFIRIEELLDPFSLFQTIFCTYIFSFVPQSSLFSTSFSIFDNLPLAYFPLSSIFSTIFLIFNHFLFSKIFPIFKNLLYFWAFYIFSTIFPTFYHLLYFQKSSLFSTIFPIFYHLLYFLPSSLFSTILSF